MDLKSTIIKAVRGHRAVGHFNVSNLDLLKAICNASQKLSLPVIIGVSEGEREFLGVKQIVALVKSLRQQGYNIYLNADHTRSLKKVAEAARAGFDAIIFDSAGSSLKDNIMKTRQAVQIVKKINKKILVEGEMGYIGKSSVVYNKLPKGAGITKESFTKPEDAKMFVKATGVDLLAPAVGNIHGMLAHGHNPKLDIGLIKKIRKAVKVPLVLHGGSGITDSDFKSAIKAGISVVHISTELRLAWSQGIKKSLRIQPGNVVPYKISGPALISVQKHVVSRLKLFNKIKQ